MAEKSIDYKQFFCRQLEAWPECRERYDALRNVCTRQLNLGDCVVTLQHNPARARSSAARIDAAAIAARGCFLCRGARPEEQTAMTVDGYELLVNPYPIFREHFTIVAQRHQPQMIVGKLHDFVMWTERLDGLTLFYNGAQCGASAPDHLHFQAAPSSMFPLWQWIDSHCIPLAPKYILCHSETEAEAVLHRLPANDGGEPPVNILARTTATGLQIVIVPRRRHRPSCYGTEGDDCVLLSPASVDMGGVWILPRKIDFQSLSAEKLKEIISETTYRADELQ